MVFELSPHRIFRYGDGGENDHGWGCVYRNTQTVLREMGVETPPSIARMMAKLGISPSKNQQEMWIEPPDANTFIQHVTGRRLSQVAYPSSRSIDRISMRYGGTDFEIVEQSEQLESMIKDSLEKHHIPIIIDDGIVSYVILGLSEGEVVIGDPHVQRNNVRVLPAEQFYSKAWMMLVPR